MEIVFIYGYEIPTDNREEALKEAFREHMKELNENPRPIIDFNDSSVQTVRLEK